MRVLTPAGGSSQTGSPNDENTLVPVRGGLIHVHPDDAYFWLVRCAAPDLMSVGFANAFVRGPVECAADLLRGDPRLYIAAVVRDGVPVDILRSLGAAKATLLGDAQTFAGRIEAARSDGAQFLAQHGSVARMMVAAFPALPVVVAALRDREDVGTLVEELYRVCAAAVCRSLLFAQLTSDHPVPARLRNAYGSSLKALFAFAGLDDVLCRAIDVRTAHQPGYGQCSAALA